MIKRRTLAVAVATTTLLGGLGAFGAVTAFASSPDTAASATAFAKSDDGKNLDAMIQHCVKQLPANQRAAAEKQMRSMMSDHDSASGHSMMHGMMGGASGTSMSGMMNGASTTSMNGMMNTTEGGS